MSDGQAKDIGQDIDDQSVHNDADETNAAFLELDGNGAIDLDALFDALNIATDGGNNSVEFTAGGPEKGGTLTISGSDLTLGSVAPEDLPDATDMLIKSSIISDES
ncbi:MAG: hypothetical protein WDZ54_04705 [Sneathiella sp.]